MVGIKEVAEALNLSISTVSRALNGRPDASEETRRRVLAAAKALGYSANQSGRALRQGTTEAVGFMMDLEGTPGSAADNFFTGTFEGVKRALAPHNLDLVVLPRSIHEDSNDYVRRIVQRRLVDGMIISGTRRDDGRIRVLQEANVPFVTLGRSTGARDYAWIDLDFEGYVRVSLERLAARGHRRVALCIYDPALNLGFVLRQAFRAEARRLGLEVSPVLEIAVSSAEGGGAELADRLLALPEPPTAVLLSYELMAIGLYHRLQARGLMPGRDIAVLGLRDSPIAASLAPRLTCFRIDIVGLGMALGRALLARMPAYAAAYPDEPAGRLWPLVMVPGESDAFHLTTGRKPVIQSLAGRT